MVDVNGQRFILSLNEYDFAKRVSLTAPQGSASADLPAAVVIGGANVDLKSQTASRPIFGTSNPGRSRASPGGVGRNVAENLARLGVRTTLVTAVGDDADGVLLLSATESAGVDVRDALQTREATGTYTAVLDDAGEMIIAVAAMDGINELTPDLIDARRALIAHARVLVLDCNVPEASMLRAATIARESGVRVVADPVSVAKAARILAVLAAGVPLHTITPNLDELRALTDFTGSSDADLRSAAAQLHASGAQQVWVRMGLDGSFLSSVQNGAQQSERLAACPATLVDVTGAGDAMLAGYVAALLRGMDVSSAAKYGHAAAAVTIESAYTVNPSIGFAALSARLDSRTVK